MKITKQQRDYILKGICLPGGCLATDNQKATTQALMYAMKEFKEHIFRCTEEDKLTDEFRVYNSDGQLVTCVQYDDQDDRFPVFISIQEDGTCAGEWYSDEEFRMLMRHLNKILEHMNAKDS